MKDKNYSWNREKYRNIIDTHYLAKKKNGITLLSLRDVYDYLSQETGIASPGAFESWAKRSSPGPNRTSLKLLEKHWGTCLSITKENKEEKNTMEHYNQFVKEHIYNIIKIIKNFIHSEEVDDEEAFATMLYHVEIESFCIPGELKKLFNEYIEEKLEPIIDSHTELFGKNPRFEDFMRYVIAAESDFNDLINDQIRPLLVG